MRKRWIAALTLTLILMFVLMPLQVQPARAQSTCYSAASYGLTVVHGTSTGSGDEITSEHRSQEGRFVGDDNFYHGYELVEAYVTLPVSFTLSGVHVSTYSTSAGAGTGIDNRGRDSFFIFFSTQVGPFTPGGGAPTVYSATTVSGATLDFYHDWTEYTSPGDNQLDHAYFDYDTQSVSNWNNANVRHIYIQYAMSLRKVGDGSGTPSTGTIKIKDIEFCTSDSIPTLTPTPSLTPTITPTGTPALPGVPTAGRCDLIRQDIATFENLYAWQILPESAGAGHPGGQIKGLTMPSGVTADLELNLDTAAQYVIRLEFHRTTASTGGAFDLRLGTEPAFKVDIDPDESGMQVFEVPAGNYTPNPGNYNLEGSALYKLALTAPTWSPNPGLVIDFICISVNTEGGGPGSGGGTGDAGGGGIFGGGIQQTACEECSYNPVGDLFQDIPRLLEWLWCGLSQLFDCVLRNVLYGLWQTIVRIIQIIAFLRLWGGLIIERAIAWVLGNLGVLAAWVGGHIVNILTAIGLPLVNFFSNFINGVLDLLRGLWGFFQQVLLVLSSIGSFLSSVGGLIGNGFQFVVSIVEQIWNLISQIVGIIPILIGSLITGLNATAETIPAWAPSCNNPSSFLFYPCVGMYILDNTIFQGPVYYLIPICIAVVSWQLINWGIKQFREALTGK